MTVQSHPRCRGARSRLRPKPPAMKRWILKMVGSIVEGFLRLCCPTFRVRTPLQGCWDGESVWGRESVKP